MKDEDTTPVSMVRALKRSARLAAAMPDEVQLIRDLTIEQLKFGPKANNADAWAHIGEHLMHIAPTVLADPRLAGFGARLNTENAKIEEAESQAHTWARTPLSWRAAPRWDVIPGLCGHRRLLHRRALSRRRGVTPSHVLIGSVGQRVTSKHLDNG